MYKTRFNHYPFQQSAHLVRFYENPDVANLKRQFSETQNKFFTASAPKPFYQLFNLNQMKTIHPNLSLALLAFAMLSSACEKEVMELNCIKPSQPGIAWDNIKPASFKQNNGPVVSNVFDFLLIKSDCFSGGIALEARPKPNTQGYAFLWEIDDLAASHYYKTGCICGTYAKVRVTRLSDGAIASKTTKLPPCESDI